MLEIGIIPELLGFMVWVGICSIFGFYLIEFDVSTSLFFITFLSINLVILLFTIRSFSWKYSKTESLFIIAFCFSLAFLSLKFRLGEEMGDNTYLMNMVSMNSIRSYINTSNFDNGFYDTSIVVGTSKEYLTWYHLFSYFTYYIKYIVQFLRMQYVPSALIYVWTGNLIFYSISAMIIINVIKEYSVKSKWIISSFLALSIYWGTIYYNLVLAHYGSNFISIFVIGFWILLTQIKKLNTQAVILIILSIYALSALGNVGLISAAYITFAYVVYLILTKNERIFYWIPFIIFPIFHWIWILSDIVPTKWLIPFGIGLSSISWIVHFYSPIKKYIYKYIVLILSIVVIFWYSLAIFSSNNFTLLFIDFFAPKSNFDRLQDFFSFVNINDSLRNVVYYSSLIFLFVNEKTRKHGLMGLIIVLFFINPIVYPMLYPPLQWLYHRAYISVFNIYVIMLGTYSLFDYVLNTKFTFKFSLLVVWILFLAPSTYQQITGYFHRIYIPGQDFNSIYKLDNNQIDILEKLRQIVIIEEYENAKVISQIYGTTMYVPEVFHIYTNFTNRRYYDPNIDEEYLDPLLRIFYTPVFPGDDGPRFNAPYAQTCMLLIDKKIDFIIYDKELSTFDKTSMNWIPIHWYARGCAEKTYENSKYIMYRFYWK
ncbi:MAG: hypothetical protein RBQ97_04475 [Acholeplasma sp.]|nr:hypothetical protein [Acholeplasma sp.]